MIVLGFLVAPYSDFGFWWHKNTIVNELKMIFPLMSFISVLELCTIRVFAQ